MTSSRLCLWLCLIESFTLAGQSVTVDTEEPLEVTLPAWKLADIRVRDPFILVEPETRMYILYAQKGNRMGEDVDRPGVEAYLSRDLQTWRGPVTVFELPLGHWGEKMVWAPEVHKYRDSYFLFVTLTSEDLLATVPNSPSKPRQHRRGTQIFRSDSPLGPYLVFSEKPATPYDWMSLDGTLFVEQEVPYLVFCHEWVQIHDGTIELLELSPDLAGPVGGPATLFKASEAPWVRNMADLGFQFDGYVTDGPYFFQTEAGKLFMIWSSFGDHQYAIGLAESRSGKVAGPWQQMEEPLFSQDGGHGMIFTTFEGKSLLVFHQPNKSPNERMVMLELEEHNGNIKLKK